MKSSPFKTSLMMTVCTPYLYRVFASNSNRKKKGEAVIVKTSALSPHIYQAQRAPDEGAIIMVSRVIN